MDAPMNSSEELYQFRALFPNNFQNVPGPAEKHFISSLLPLLCCKITEFLLHEPQIFKVKKIHIHL